MTDHDKKISGVEAPMNPVQQQSAPSEGRRRLVKGVIIGTPAILMVRGGYSRPLASLDLDDPQAIERICASLGAAGEGSTLSLSSFYGGRAVSDNEAKAFADDNCQPPPPPPPI